MNTRNREQDTLAQQKGVENDILDISRYRDRVRTECNIPLICQRQGLNMNSLRLKNEREP